MLQNIFLRDPEHFCTHIDDKGAIKTIGKNTKTENF